MIKTEACLMWKFFIAKMLVERQTKGVHILHIRRPTLHETEEDVSILPLFQVFLRLDTVNHLYTSWKRKKTLTQKKEGDLNLGRYILCCCCCFHFYGFILLIYSWRVTSNIGREFSLYRPCSLPVPIKCFLLGVLFWCMLGIWLQPIW